ncbi:MAG: autotransporter outer membrane beta-barrel domain-containing protein [Hyphomicrobium sp.]
MAIPALAASSNALEACTAQLVPNPGPPPPFFIIRPAEECAPLSVIGNNVAIVGQAFANRANDFQNKQADSQVLSNTGFAAGAAAGLPGVFPTGRLAHSEHDGQTVSNGNDRFKLAGYDVDEYSGYVNLQFEGRPSANSVLRIAPFIGGANVDVGYDGNLANADNDSMMGGVNILYAVGQTYGVVLVAFDSGKTSYDLPTINQEGRYRTTGYALTAALGHTMQAGNNIFVDVRGGLAYSEHEGDGHTTRTNDPANSVPITIGKSQHELFTGSLNMMLFTVWNTGETRVRPFVKGGVKFEFDEDNTLELPAQLGIQAGKLSFEDDDIYFNVESGLHINVGQNWDFVGSGYYEGSGDEDIFGGRFAIQYKFK